MEEAFEEIETLIKEEVFLQKIFIKIILFDFKKRKTVVKALCLHIAHDCNLACRYCFAEEGEYHGRRAIMSYEVGKQALDFSDRQFRQQAESGSGISSAASL